MGTTAPVAATGSAGVVLALSDIAAPVAAGWGDNVPDESLELTGAAAAGAGALTTVAELGAEGCGEGATGPAAMRSATSVAAPTHAVGIGA